jgi:hypothetical protein
MTRQDKPRLLRLKKDYEENIIHILLIGALDSVAQKQYKIVYNVYEDTARDNYDIYSMNMDGTGKKILPIPRELNGFIMLTKTKYISSVIKTHVIVVIFI